MKAGAELRQVGTMLKTVATWLLVLAVALLTNLFLFTTVGIRGDSMSPALQNGDRALVPVWQDWWPGIRFQRGDIVFFPDPQAASCRLRCPYVIKRIIALPGEAVSISNGVVSIGGQELEEPWLENTWKGSLSMGSQLVPEGTYFVMGDNRFPYGSFDSRTYGPVAADSIAGRTSSVLWPPLRRTDSGWQLNLRRL